MNRVVWGKEGEKALVMDVRDLMHGEYSVERRVQGGYESVFCSPSLDKCIAKAKQIIAETV